MGWRFTINGRTGSVRVLVSLSLALILVSALGITALAAQGATTTVTVGSAKMTLDCSSMSKSVHAYAVAHDYCPALGGSVTPFNVTAGDCGSAALAMANYGHNYAQFSYGFHSTQGNVVYRSLGLNWTNWNTGGSGSSGDSGWMNNSYYSTTRNQLTYSGYVTGSMSGWVLLWWGGTCTIIPPSSSAQVS
jgi:hypothetical protein